MCDGPVSTTLDNCFTPSPGCFGSYHATTTKMCLLLKRPQRGIFLDFRLFLSPHSPSWLLSPHISHEESGRKSWVTRLCSRPFTFLYLSVAHSTYLSQALGFFHLFMVSVLLCCMSLRYTSCLCLFPTWCEQREMTF